MNRLGIINLVCVIDQGKHSNPPWSTSVQWIDNFTVPLVTEGEHIHTYTL